MSRFINVLYKPIIIESHAGTYQCGGKAQAGMPGTENGIIYLFADRIQNGCIGIPVFGNSMCLYGEAAGIIGIVQFIQEDAFTMLSASMITTMSHFSVFVLR